MTEDEQITVIQIAVALRGYQLWSVRGGLDSDWEVFAEAMNDDDIFPHTYGYGRSPNRLHAYQICVQDMEDYLREP